MYVDKGLVFVLFALFKLAFETNQAGELPIILKRRNNAQTGHNKKTTTHAGWIGTKLA